MNLKPEELRALLAYHAGKLAHLTSNRTGITNTFGEDVGNHATIKETAERLGQIAKELP